MDKIRKKRMEGMTNDDIFSIYTEYVKKEITQDLRYIYEKEARPLDAREPWVFKIKED